MKRPTSRPPENAPESPTNSKAGKPPKGMWFEHREGQPLPFLARWRLPGGKKDGQAFETAKDRADFAEAWAEKRKNYGRAAVHVSPRDAEALAEFRKITNGADLVTVAHEWKRLKGAEANPLQLGDAWKAFNDDQEGRSVAADSHSHRRVHGQRFLAHFGKERAIQSIKPNDLDAWLKGLTDPETGKPFAAKTRAGHLKTVRHLYEWHFLRRHVDHNPALAVTPPEATTIDVETGEAVHRDVNILSLADARTLFSKNRDALCIGRLAFEAFGGARYTTAKRLRREHIQWTDEGIEMPGHLHKSGERHFVQGWPTNLWAWMKHAPDAGWDLTGRMYADLKRDAFVRAGLKPPEPAPEEKRDWTDEQLKQFEAMRNVLRHSFGTYHLAAYRKPSETLELMTKTSLRSLNRDYRGRATQAAGLEYFSIMP